MKQFSKYVWTSEPKRVDFTQYKSRQMYLSNVFTYNDHRVKIVMSYNTYIGFIVDNRTLITWGYSQYSCTTSKQITQLSNECELIMRKVKKFSYDDLEMLLYYLDSLL